MMIRCGVVYSYRIILVQVDREDEISDDFIYSYSTRSRERERGATVTAEQIDEK